MLLNTESLLRKAPKEPYGHITAVNPNRSDGLPIEFLDKACPYEFSQPYVVELDNVDLCGPIAVCFWNGDIVLDVAYFGRMDTWDRNRTYFNQAIESKSYFDPTYIEKACSLLGVWSGNYFHWTLEVLPMVEAILPHKGVVILLEHQPKTWVFDSLAELGISNVLPIENMHYQVDKLLVPTVRRRDGRTSPDSIQFLKNKTAHIPPGPYEKIYISRKDTTKRQVTNEREVMKFLAGRGFQPVVFDGMKWKDQVSIAKGAKVVVAPHGAGLVNMVYSQQKPAIIELATPEYLNPCFYTMAAAMGSEYKLLVGDPEPGENIRINIEELERLL